VDLILSIEAFVRVAETQSLANASRPDRSRQIRRHHARKATRGASGSSAVSPLYARGETVTESGELYYRDCSELLQKVQDLSFALAGREQRAEGHSAHPCPAGVPRSATSPRLLTDFRSAYPTIDFEVMVNDRVVDPVKEGLDLGPADFPAGVRIP
jgi:DNA-binding transcriptional LysR family regulator